MSDQQMRPTVGLTQWHRQGNYCHHCGNGEWYVAPGHLEIRKKLGLWVATWKGQEVARDEALSNVMDALSMPMADRAAQ